MSMAGWLRVHARPHRWRLALVAMLMLAGSLATLTIPWLVGQLAGGILTGVTAHVPLIVGGLLALLAAQGLLAFASAWLSAETSHRLLADLRIALHDHLQSLPLAFHQERRQGETLALMTYEIERLNHFVTGTLVSVPPLLLTAAGAVVLMFRIDATLALLVPLSIPAFYLALKLIGRRLRGLARRIQEAEAAAIGTAEEHLTMLPAIKSFVREAPESARYARQIEDATNLSLKEARIYAGLEPMVQFIAAAAAVLMLWLAGRTLQQGALSPGDLVSFLLYAAVLTRPVASLSHLYGQVQTARGTLQRLAAVLAEPPEPGHAATGRMERARGEIAFRNVSFAYPGREPALRDLDLVIPAGETLALTGENGAGKSTLVALLQRLYTPQAGAILIDGQDISGLALADLRRQIGDVPQRPLLFNGTVAANIGYGREGASETQIEAAARLAQAHEFITHLPQGYGTEIGDNGVRLSGGQRQRIALARALLKDPPILVLDEATAMFDLEGEEAFIAACAEAFRERTVILITHRPASLALADRILTLHEGRVSEDTRRAP
jgi:ABC-type multidrug transport system fused ATPase/permease subunit